MKNYESIWRRFTGAKTEFGRTAALKKFGYESIQDAAKKIALRDKKAISAAKAMAKKIKLPKEFLPFYLEANSAYESKVGADAPAWVEGIIKDDSFGVAEFGRTRKNYKGENRYLCKGVRTDDNGRGGWDRVVWHYADYFCKQVGNKILYRLADGSHGIGFISPSGNSAKIGGVIYKKTIVRKTPKLHNRQILRAINKYLHSPLACGVDADGLFIQHQREKYHFERSSSVKTEYYKGIIRASVSAFKKRREIERGKVLEEWAMGNLSKIWVGESNSISAGNCKIGTSQFVSREGLSTEGGALGLRADYLLEIRNDSFTKRAVVEAAKKYNQ